MNIERLKSRLDYLELEEMIKMRNELRGLIEATQRNAKIVSLRNGQLIKTRLEKVSLLSQAVSSRKAGLSLMVYRPKVGDLVKIRGRFKGRTDFESAQTVKAVGETTFQLTNGWSCFARLNGWQVAGHPDLGVVF